MISPIPQHLQGYITEAIQAGHRDPDAILQSALDRCNAMCQEMIEGDSDRSRLVREAMYIETFAAGKYGATLSV